MSATDEATNQDRDRAAVRLLPLSRDPFPAPTDRDMVPSERRRFVETHRTCVFGYGRRSDGPAMSVVYYVPAENGDLLVATMADRAKAKAVGRDSKVSLCILDETWPFAYLQVYCDAAIDPDGETLVDVMMAVAERMSGEALGTGVSTRWSRPWETKRAECSFAVGLTRPLSRRHDICTATTKRSGSPTGSRRPCPGTLPTLPTERDVSIRQRGGPFRARRFADGRWFDASRVELAVSYTTIRWRRGASSTIFTERPAPSPRVSPTDRLRDADVRPPIPVAPERLRRRAQLPIARRRVRHGAAQDAARLYEVPELPDWPAATRSSSAGAPTTTRPSSSS